MRSSKRLALAIELFKEIDHLLKRRRTVAASNPAVGNKEAVAKSIDEQIEFILKSKELYG